MSVRPFRTEDAETLARLAGACARGESDFVLNPLWESEEELFAEFERHRIDPREHVLVAEAGDGQVIGVSGFLRRPGSPIAGLLCPIVDRSARGRGTGGALLRATLKLGQELGIKSVAAGIGTRNRSGYSLLTGLGFRPVRQHFLMRCNEPPAQVKAPVPGLELATATAADAEGILAVYRACGFEERSDESMRAVLQDGRHAHAVAHRDGAVMGFAELETHWPRRIWVAFVGVAPELRAKGLGSALVGWELGREFREGAKSALLLLSPANRTALRAYEKVGFRRHRTFDVLERGL